MSVELAPDRSAPPNPQSASSLWRAEPFLHVEPSRLYNPLTDRSLAPESPGYAAVRALALGESTPDRLEPALRGTLAAEGWLVEEAQDLASRFLLKYVSFEANSVCNQGCYFCPVSTHPREAHTMSLELYEDITRQLAEWKDTLIGVSMINYNEPTVDKHFVERVAMLRRYGLPPAVLTNGWGLTPARVDTILGLGGLKYLSVNLSTLDRERYAADRRGDHLPVVLRNMDYVKNVRLAETMEIAVLGQGDAVHKRDFDEISTTFAGSLFDVKYYEVMNRAGNVMVGLRPTEAIGRLCGCEQTGSRPLQWVHITPRGECVLCCQDYHEQYVVGDLGKESLRDILTGPRMALMRRWVYGLEEAPADFICRNCIYALSR